MVIDNCCFYDVGERLDVSPAWVSLRLGLIEEGNINWTLKVLKEKTASLSQEIELSADERRIISDLEILQNI
ncbi:MAG: hypothetical protein U9N32_09880 [Spirochaetota bacterium]|nr:hypothetical protein [Spirochaetota bacterium]